MHRPGLLLAGVATLSLIGMSGCGDASHGSAVQARRAITSTSPPMTTVPLPSTTTTLPSQLTIEPCGGITENRTVQPTVSLESLLLEPSDVPAGFASTGPRSTVGVHFVASVPSTVPVAYVTFETPPATPRPDQLSTPSSGISEAIGEVGSAQVAAQVVAATDAAAARGQGTCQSFRTTGTLPGSVPDLVAIEESGGGSSAGSGDFAYVLAAKGPYVVSLMVANQTTANADPGASAVAAPPPVLPSDSDLAVLVDAALARIPG